MTEPQELSIEERRSRNDAVRDLTRSLKTETESRLQETHDDVQVRKLDEDHAAAQKEFSEEVTRALGSGTISDARAAMLLAAAGIDPAPIEVPVPLLVTTQEDAKEEEPPGEGEPPPEELTPAEQAEKTNEAQDGELAAAAPVDPPKQMAAFGATATGEEK